VRSASFDATTWARTRQEEELIVKVALFIDQTGLDEAGERATSHGGQR
jgi:hypothetical protein